MTNPVSPTAIGFPRAPFVDAQTGDIATVWRSFLLGLYHRTGAAVGVSSTGTVAGLAAEVAARAAGDTSLSDSISAEASARIAGIAAEAARALAAEALLQAEIGSIGPSGGADNDAPMLTRLWFATP